VSYLLLREAASESRPLGPLGEPLWRLTKDGHPADARARALDAAINRNLLAYEAQLRQDVTLTGKEDQEALDRPPDPGSSWRRATAEELVEAYREQLRTWRSETLTALRPTFALLLRAS
jgi:hypothetical protein